MSINIILKTDRFEIVNFIIFLFIMHVQVYPALLLKYFSGDEIHENSRTHLDRLQNKCTICKGVENNTNFGQIYMAYKRNWIKHINRMPR